MGAPFSVNITFLIVSAELSVSNTYGLPEANIPVLLPLCLPELFPVQNSSILAPSADSTRSGRLQCIHNYSCGVGLRPVHALPATSACLTISFPCPDLPLRVQVPPLSRPLQKRARAAPISRAEPAPPFSHFPLLFHSPNPTAAASPTLPLGNVNFGRQGSIYPVQYFSLLMYFCIPSLTAYQLPEKDPSS